MAYSVTITGNTSAFSPEQKADEEARIHDIMHDLVHGGKIGSVGTALWSSDTLGGMDLITDPCVSKVGK